MYKQCIAMQPLAILLCLNFEIYDKSLLCC